MNEARTSSSRRGADAAKPPNVVIFLADDLGYDDLSCYGSTVHHTPNLDSLARGGVRFVDLHSNGCMCSPTRAALLTGRYQQRCGMERVLGPACEGRPPMGTHETTFAHRLRDAGYATGMFGKYHTGYIPHQSPNRMGFDTFRGLNGGMDHHSRFNRWGEAVWYHDETLVEDEEGYSTELITSHALRFIDEHRDGPFLLYLADWMVHFPWQGPDDPVDFRKGVDNSSPERKYGSVPDRRRAYRDMVEALDSSVGRIVDRLRELGIEQNTLLFFASDNGGHELVCENRPLNGAKGSMLEGGHRVPGIAYWPGVVPAGVESEDTVLLFDLYPTLLELAGATQPAGRPLDGCSLLGLLTRSAPLPERRLFWRQGAQGAVREGRWKLFIEGERARLFDLDADIGETRDLAAKHPERVAAMKAAFGAWCENVDADGRASLARPG